MMAAQEKDSTAVTGKQIVDIYPLSAMQQGMLFHSLYEPGSGAYVIQLSCLIQGKLNVSTFEQAWQKVIARHPSLRTDFDWESADEPVQIVSRNVTAPIHLHDWRDLSPARQTTQLEAWLEQDRAYGFDLSDAPLMRLTLFRLEDDAYQFVWSVHHLLVDGWSQPLILTDLFIFYDGLLQNYEPNLAAAPPYRHYIAWLQKQDRQAAKAFWQQTLHQFTEPTPLRIKQMPATTSAQTYMAQSHALPVSITETLRNNARRHQLTLSTLIHGAWALLLHCYSGRDDVVFGTAVSGRPPALPQAEKMVGVFVNTQPLRVKISPTISLLTWLEQVQDALVAARPFEHSSLIQIQQWSDVPPGTPLFHTILSFSNSPGDRTNLDWYAPLQINNLRFIEQTNYPLSLQVEPGSELSLKLMYDGRLFEEEDIRRILQQLQTLLTQMASDLAQPLVSLSLLNQATRHHIIREWNETASVYPEQTFHSLFEQAAARTPAAIAVNFQGEQLTYRALDQYANQLAHYLQANGIGPETLVGLCLEGSPELIIGLLGILKAGAAFLPLDPAYPPAHLSFMLADAQVPILLTKASLLPRLPTGTYKTTCLDADWAMMMAYPTTKPATTANIDNLAYAIYTSGSTGQPKAALLSHRGLANLSEAQVKLLDLQADDRILQLASLSFDAFVFEVVMALRVGATLYLNQRQQLLPGPELVTLLRCHGITIITITPSALAVLPPADLPELRLINVAGEACSPHLVTRWSKGRRFFNLYGPTEATIWTTAAKCIQEETIPPIGQPIPNSQIYVLDRYLNPVPVGIPGELYIGGIGLARGYLDRPGLTAQQFIPNPFVTTKEQAMTLSRLYKTGDQVCWRVDGNLEFLGRIDYQVKIRGFRIEPGEIEATLKQHPSVAEGVVTVYEAASEEKQLVAYVVPKGDQELDTRQLRSFMREQVPGYKVPATFVVLNALPLTPNGKVNRKHLPPPTQAQRVSTSAYTPPRSQAEEMIAAVWQDILQVERVGRHDNFFDLGGHSLKILKVHQQLTDIFARPLQMADMFKYTTVAKLAAFLTQSDPQTGNQPDEITQKAKQNAAAQRASLRRRARHQQEKHPPLRGQHE